MREASYDPMKLLKVGKQAAKPDKAEAAQAEATAGQTDPARAAIKGNGTPSFISPDLKVIGDLQSAGEIQIAGSVKGDIKAGTVTLNEGAHVEGAIIAEVARISGSVNGRIEAASVVIAKSAKVEGDVVHQSLEVEAGAFLEGHCRRIESEKADGYEKLSATKAAQPGAAPKVGAPQGVASGGGKPAV